MGAKSPQSMHRCRRRILLQAMGRENPEGRGTRARWPDLGRRSDTSIERNTVGCPPRARWSARSCRRAVEPGEAHVRPTVRDGIHELDDAETTEWPLVRVDLPGLLGRSWPWNRSENWDRVSRITASCPAGH